MTRTFARFLLRAYPLGFRRVHGRAFVECASHRWTRELEATGRGGLATVRTGLVFCADTLGAAPGSWSKDSGWRTGSPDGPPRPPFKDVFMSWITGSLSDLRLAARLMRGQPASAALVVVTLALGIGVSTAAFGALDRVVLKPLPFARGDRMHYLAVREEALGWQLAPSADLINRWQTGARTLEDIGVFQQGSAVWLDRDQADFVDVERISSGLPAMLGVRPLLGRMIGPADAAPDAPAAVMVTESFWRRELAGDPDVVGRVLRLRSGPVTVVGVWPGEARFDYSGTPDLIRAAVIDDAFLDRGWSSVLAVVAPGASPTAVVEELTALAAGVEDGLPEGMVPALVPPHGFIGDSYVQGLWLVFAGAVVLLVVALVNTTNLLLGRATTRDAELAIRLALGGSTARLLRLFLAESLLLTSLGVVAGFAVAVGTAQAYAAWDPRGLVGDRQTWLENRTLVFGALAAGISMFAGTVVPAWRGRSARVQDVLAATASTRTTGSAAGLRMVLIGAQAALAVLLATGAALTARSYDRLAAVDPGFDVDPLAMVSVRAPAERYPTADGQQQFIDRVRDAIESLPQVRAITAVNAPPFRTSSGSIVPHLEGLDDQGAPAGARSEVSIQNIDLRYFDVFGTPLVAGRRFVADDVDQSVMINESFARALGENVVGRRLLMGESSGYVIVGIVRDVRSTSLTSDPAGRPQLYFFRSSTPSAYERFVFRVDGNPESAIADVRARVSALDQSVPLSEAATFRDLFDAETARHRLVSYLLFGLALFGVVFAMSGVYGVVSLDVSRRTREVGVRMALGATPAQVVRALVGRGVRPVAVGAGLGVALSLWTAPFLEDLLFGVPARDPWSALAGVVLVVATAGASSLLPARRASRVDPALTLRA